MGEVKEEMREVRGMADIVVYLIRKRDESRSRGVW